MLWRVTALFRQMTGGAMPTLAVGLAHQAHTTWTGKNNFATGLLLHQNQTLQPASQAKRVAKKAALLTKQGAKLTTDKALVQTPMARLFGALGN